MKIYKVNSLTTFIFAFFIVGLLVFLPIILIDAAWNGTIGKTYDIQIDFWQGLILWLVVLVLLNIVGAFKFEFAIETADSFDKELLKKKLESLQSKTKEMPENDKKVKKDTEEPK